jgi:hypothetical protein
LLQEFDAYLRREFGAPETAPFLTRMVAALPAHESYNDALNRCFVRGHSPLFPRDFQTTGVLSILCESGRVDPKYFLNLDAIRSCPVGSGSWNRLVTDYDPALPILWTKAHPVSALRSCALLLEAEPADELATLAAAFERILQIRYPGSESPPVLLRPLAVMLAARREAEALHRNDLLTSSCWEWARIAFQDEPDAFPETYRRSLGDEALKQLGGLRSLLRAPNAEQRLTQLDRYFDNATTFLLRLRLTPPWAVLKRLLLAFRELPKRSVALDLRTWWEGQLEPLPLPWCKVPELVAHVFNSFVGALEQTNDPQLASLRTEFAEFCLERLKTKSKATEGAQNEDFVEPEPIWRCGYVNAVRELSANPRGRGHHTLNWSRRNDPDESVRQAAERAYRTVRNSHGLPEGISPRRPLFAAFWWLRQAHVLACGEQPSATGAQRTFRKEVRRSQEPD